MYTPIHTNPAVKPKGSARSVTEPAAVRHRPSFTLLITILLLICLGLVMLYSASSIYALESIPPKPSNYFFIRQIEWLAIGLPGMILLMNIPYRRWYKLAPVCLISSFLLLLAPFGFHKILGARRWIEFGSLTLQPSEIAIIAVILYLSFLFSRSWGTPRMKEEYLRALIIIAVGMVLIILEPDFGTSMMLLIPAMAIVIAAGIPMKSLSRLLLLAVPVLAIVVFKSAYRLDRIRTFFNPSSDISDSGYQLQNSYYALAHGGWLGNGIGQSIQKYLYLPEGQTDFIFAIIVEELGLLKAFVIILLFAVLIYKGFDVALKTKDSMGRLIAIGFTTMIGFSVFINIGTVTGLIPVTGIPLPFISAGGTSLITNMWSMGILLNISRYTEE